MHKIILQLALAYTWILAKLALIRSIILTKVIQLFFFKKTYQNSKKPYIVAAYDNNMNDATFAFNCLLKWFWDDELCDDLGGIPLNKLIEILPKNTKLINIIFLEPNQIDFSALKFILIDLHNLTFIIKKGFSFGESLEPEKILFNQLGFWSQSDSSSSICDKIKTY